MTSRDEWNADTSSKAGSLLRSTTDFQFIAVFMHYYASAVPRPHSLSTAEDLRHCRNVDGVHTALEKVRHDLEQRHADWWRDVVALAEKIGHGSVTLSMYR